GSLVRLTSLFLRRSAHPRALHSFPTRRSSDLASASAASYGHPRTCHAEAAAAQSPGPSRPARLRHETSSDTAQRARRSRASARRSEEHTSELQHDQISYAVFCLKKKTKKQCIR